MIKTSIITPISLDGLVGFDTFGQLWAYRPDPVDPADALQGRIVPDVRREQCLICGNPFDLSGPGYWNVTSEKHLNSLLKFSHKTCLNGYRRHQEMGMWEVLLPNTGFCYRAIEIPNGYGQQDYHLPWYQIVLYYEDREKDDNMGCRTLWSLRVGKRKHVWHIGVHGLDEAKQAVFKTLWANEKVTNGAGPGSFYIHAYHNSDIAHYFTQIGHVLRGECHKLKDREVCNTDKS